jgi:hypothetical protein
MANEDPTYLAWLRHQRCCAPGPAHPGGDPHHATHLENGGGVGMGMRGHDHRAIPLCRRCHTDLHAMAGAFRAWNRDFLRAWTELKIDECRRRYLATEPEEVTPVTAPPVKCAECCGKGFIMASLRQATTCEECYGTGVSVHRPPAVVPSTKEGT